ncbi:hypothetical protein K2P56_03620 [Patescibacteria group bacterium]|nr:hypothetical protein [Patescibacteria group bacterium]
MASVAKEKATGDPVPSEAHLKKVCRHGQGEKACKFLAVGGSAGPLCMKANVGYKQAHFYRKIDLKTFPGDPQGENCTGAPDFLITGRVE